MGSTRNSGGTTTSGGSRSIDFTDDERREIIIKREAALADVPVSKIKAVHKAMSISDPLETPTEVNRLVRYAAKNGIDLALEPEASRLARLMTGQVSGTGVVRRMYDFSGLGKRMNAWVDQNMPDFFARFREEPRGDGISDYYID